MGLLPLPGEMGRLFGGLSSVRFPAAGPPVEAPTALLGSAFDSGPAGSLFVHLCLGADLRGDRAAHQPRQR